MNENQRFMFLKLELDGIKAVFDKCVSCLMSTLTGSEADNDK